MATSVPSSQRSNVPNQTTIFNTVKNLIQRVSALERATPIGSASVGAGGLTFYDEGGVYFFLRDQEGTPGRIFPEEGDTGRRFLRLYAPSTDPTDVNANRISIEGSTPGDNGAVYLYSDGNIQLRVEDSEGAKTGFILFQANQYALDNPSAVTGVNAQLVSVGGGLYELTRPTSSLKYKQDVEDAEIDLAEVLSLRPVVYREKRAVDLDPDAAVHIGLIAEEVAEHPSLAPLVALLDGEPDSVRYDRLVIALLALAKDQQAKMNEMSNELEKTVELLSALSQDHANLVRRVDALI